MAPNMLETLRKFSRWRQTCWEPFVNSADGTKHVGNPSKIQQMASNMLGILGCSEKTIILQLNSCIYNIRSQSDKLTTHIAHFMCYLGPARRLFEPEIELMVSAVRNQNTDWFIVTFDISELSRANTRTAVRWRTLRWTESVTVAGDRRIGTKFGNVG